MSQRYHRGGTYQTRNPLARTSPLRSIPLFQPASILLRAPMPVFPPAAAPVFTDGRGVPFVLSDKDQAIRDLANAEAALRDVIRVYDAARAGIGEANRTSTAPVVSGGRVVMAARPFTAERIRERKSYAFRMFNQRRGELCRARRCVDAARAALGLPSLAATEERVGVAVVVRASKRRTVVYHPIASAAAHAA